MKLFVLEHEKAAYRVDFALYGVAIAGLLLFLLLSDRGDHRLDSTVLVIAGLLVWSALEYASHRFVLHGVAPFSRWHAEHHRRPAALIYTPTLLSGLLFAGLVFLPLWWLGDLRRASALTLGVLLGYQLGPDDARFLSGLADTMAWTELLDRCTQVSTATDTGEAEGRTAGGLRPCALPAADDRGAEPQRPAAARSAG